MSRTPHRIACTPAVTPILVLAFTAGAVAQPVAAPADAPPKPGAWRFAYRGITEGATTDTAELRPANYRPAVTFGPQARKEFTVKRQEVFEFARKPKIARTDSGIAIDFGSKGWCDATVAIEDAGGAIIRHLASGLLGKNAPEPFQKDSLKQHLIWDGRDDWGAAVKDLETCNVRVSLGLKAGFERNLHYHPKKKLGRSMAIAADADGVYVYENNVLYDYVLKFDHEGHYVRTLYPFAADQLKEIKGLNWQRFPPDGVLLPDKGGGWHTTMLDFWLPQHHFQGPVGSIAAGGGSLAILGTVFLVRLGTDGTTGRMDLLGPRSVFDVRSRYGANRVPARSAGFSPDGKWLYLAAVPFDEKHNKVRFSGVYRMAFDGDKGPELFIAAQETDTDAEHFARAGPIAVDAKGRIYVCDVANNRVQAYTPDGKFHKSLPADCPTIVKVHQRTGAIYVFSFVTARRTNYGYRPQTTKAMVRKFAPIEKPALLMEADLMEKGTPYAGHFARGVELDSWSREPTFWLMPYDRRDTVYGSFAAGGTPTAPCLFVERDGKLVLKERFDDTYDQAGFLPQYATMQRQQLYFDPAREILYVAEMYSFHNGFNALAAIDVNTASEKLVKLPTRVQELGMDAKGLLYCRLNDGVVRYDPATWKEVPFEHGQARENFQPEQYSRRISVTGAIVAPGGWNDKNNPYNKEALAVSPQGDVAFAHNFFDRKGTLRRKELLAGLPGTRGGLDLDWRGNLYAAVQSPRLLDGRPFGIPTWGNGALIKVKAQDLDKARLLYAGTQKQGWDSPAPKIVVPKGEEPQRPRETDEFWVEGAQWVYGASPCSTLMWRCNCRSGRFKTDDFGRSFVPEPWRYSIGVLDTNGNLIARFGRYGNADSAGPKGLVPLGGDEIGLFDPQYVAVQTDRRLFIADVGNGRIVSAKLDYHATERVPLSAAK